MSIYGNFINEKSKLLNYNNGKYDDKETTVMSKKEHEEYIKKFLSRMRTVLTFVKDVIILRSKISQVSPRMIPLL